MKPHLTDEKIVKAENTLRNWARGIISGKYTRDWKFRKGTKTLIIGYRNLRQFLMVINDLIYYKSKSEELQQALEQINQLRPVACEWTDEEYYEKFAECEDIARQALERTKP